MITKRRDLQKNRNEEIYSIFLTKLVIVDRLSAFVDAVSSTNKELRTKNKELRVKQ